MSVKHFLDISDYDAETIKHILERAIEIKKNPIQSQLKDKTLGLIFQKPSTRTRVSFEVGMLQLGGKVISLQPDEVGLGKREAVKDVARVMSRYVDIVMIRTFEHKKLEEFAEFGSIPVINGLSDHSHPCQAMADAMTVIEHFDRWNDITITYLGDGNNVCLSLIEVCEKLGWTINVACPEGFEPQTDLPHNVIRDAKEAVKDSDVIYTDVWTSMGQEEETKKRLALFAPYQVNDDILNAAKPEAVFMHCLPAHRDEEVTDSVVEGEKSIIFDQAENRLHAQKGVLSYLMS
jgi:ornithine carbamoyltransferase